MCARLLTNVTCLQSKYISKSTNFHRYENDIKWFRYMDVETEKKLIKEYQNLKNGREKYRLKKKLMEQHQRFIISCAKKYESNGDNLLDLIQEGNIGLAKALDFYDETKDAKFLTYAAYHIRREINEYQITKKQTVRFPSATAMIQRMKNVRRELYNTLEREPTNDEIELVMNKRYQFNCHDLLSIFNQSNSIDDGIDEDNDVSVSIIKTFDEHTASINSYEKTVDEDYNKTIVGGLMSTLDNREKDIIIKIYGLNGNREYTIDEISKEYGLCPERIRQIRNESLNKMKQKR